jgi:phosphoribosylamine--glycine ligase
MKLLIVGSGGREHAIVKKCLCSDRVEQIFVAPGNPGIELEAKTTCVDINAGDIESLLSFSKENKIDLCVVGPEVSLEKGIVDLFEEHYIPVFGPKRAAAELEFSKVFAKKIMKQAGVKTARYLECSTYEEAEKGIRDFSSEQMVIKADGLAAGKGVFVCETKEQALKAANALLNDKNFSISSEKILIEQKLKGRELSAFAICDGDKAVFIGSACDYKRIYTNDEGPNTGGMGAFSPVNWVCKLLEDHIQKNVFDKIMQTMKNNGTPFKGVLYAGLMIDKDENGDWNPLVIEFNTRFGDPETQVILPLIDEDLMPWFLGAANGNLTTDTINLKNRSAVHIVLAAKGYPGTEGESIQKNDPIKFEPFVGEDEYLFFAGVKKEGEQFLTNGGRVLGVTCIDHNRMLARAGAYRLLKKVSFQGSQIREDIGL